MQPEGLLGYHLTYHQLLDDEFDTMTLRDDFSVPLDIAMLARRDGIPGLKTPKGYLTKLRDTTFSGLIRQIEDHENPKVGELGFMLLQLGEETARSLGSGIGSRSTRCRLTYAQPSDLPTVGALPCAGSRAGYYNCGGPRPDSLRS